MIDDTRINRQAFLEWLAEQPKDGTYRYTSNQNCVIGLWLQSLGYSEPNVGPTIAYLDNDSDTQFNIDEILGMDVHNYVMVENFGELLDLINEFHCYRIGSATFKYRSHQQASKHYRAILDKHGLGVSAAPLCTIRNRYNKIVGRISYNGRVWLGRNEDWKAEDTPIYDPMKQDA